MSTDLTPLFAAGFTTYVAIKVIDKLGNTRTVKVKKSNLKNYKKTGKSGHYKKK